MPTYNPGQSTRGRSAEVAPMVQISGNAGDGALSRRALLRQGAALGLGLPSAVALLEACGGSSSGGSTPKNAIAGTAVMSNYPDWMGAHVVADFERLHPGSKIKQINSASSSIAGTVQQLKSGTYDFALADASATGQAVAVGIVAPLDWSKIPNIKNVSQSFRSGFPHGIPTDYGKVGIGYRPDLVGEKISSWHDVWRLAPKFSGKVVFIDLDRDCMGSTLKYLGHSGNSTVPSQLNACKDALVSIKPHLQAFLNTNVGQGLQDGSTVIAMDWDYDVALNKQKQPKIEWVFPSEGMVAYIEGWIAVKSSQRLPLVETFMNFALEPRQYADFVNTTGTAYVEPAATAFVAKSIANNPVLRPGHAIAAVEYEHFLGQATALWTNIWQEVKAA
jgi:spermidine/putrescine transport system substrate-binding protein